MGTAMIVIVSILLFIFLSFILTIAIFTQSSIKYDVDIGLIYIGIHMAAFVVLLVAFTTLKIAGH